MITRPKDFDKELLSYRHYLITYCVSLTNSRDAADDLSQIALMRAIARWDSFEPGTNMQAWLGTITHNSWVNICRRAQSFYEIPADDHGEISNVPELISAPAQEHVVAVGEIGEILERLSTSRRDILLYVGAGYSYPEISDLCGGIPIGTVRSRISRARNEVAALMGAA